MNMFIPQPYKRLKRGPQVILPKDIGVIMAYTGVNRDSVCVDAGTGSGWLAVSLARVAKHVTSYEIRPEFVKIAEKNKENEHLDNLVIRNADISKKIYEKDVDIITLDMPDSDKVISKVSRALKPGGYVVGYLPHTEQVKAFVAKLERYKFRDIFVAEIIMRDMLVRKEGVRPSTKGVWHTGYLAFAQKS